MKRFRFFSFLSAAFLFLVPAFASAHEVYVLSSSEIAEGISAPPFNMLAVLMGDLAHFLFWAFVGILLVFIVFFASITRTFERALDPWLLRLRRFAAPAARITIGISFLAAAYYQASYGPELPLTSSFGAWSPAVTGILIAIGLAITFGFFTRTAALIALLLYGVAVWHHGIYMLTYTNYLGEILVLLILGAHHGASSARHGYAGKGLFEGIKRAYERFAKALAPYSFLILRVTFGISLLYASIYAKVLHNNLALMVADLPLAGHAHNIASALGFEPHFLVLGAAIVEIVIALFFIFGIEIRFTSLFLEFWLTLSLLYFGEVVWPHVILIGIPIAFIFAGYDKYSLEGYLFKKNGFEPIL